MNENFVQPKKIQSCLGQKENQQLSWQHGILKQK
jgi:hypothetical protein